MDSGSTVSTTTAVLIALISGLVGSALAILGTFAITWRSETRSRRARLRALEYELRGNKLVIEGTLTGQAMPSKLSSTTWNKLIMELALDVSPDTYRQLQNFYWLYDDGNATCTRLQTGGANEQETKNLEYWKKLCYSAEAHLAGELHPSRRFKARVQRYVSRLIPFGRSRQQLEEGLEATNQKEQTT